MRTSSSEEEEERPEPLSARSEPQPQPTYQRAPQPRQGGIGGILSALGGAGVLLWKVLGVLKFAAFGKYLLTAGSALVSIWFYSQRYGMPYAVGLVLMLFVHECGHAIAARRFGLPYSGMLFIPFMGAVVAHGRGKTNVVQDAFIGIMGPVVGGLYGIVCVVLGFVTGNPFFFALASSTFAINLFNLIPTVPLDGGWIAPIFSPKLLAVGAVLLVLVGFLNPAVWVLALLSLPRIIAGWKAGPGDEYFQATTTDRWKYGLAYLGLALGLVVGEIFAEVALMVTRR